MPTNFTDSNMLYS